ncbi:MAG TPA: CPBP family intramembrane glutamic endopeptidase [Candidatus Babeliales bacterium]|nr:CPBP family intramembrane glutamic endopeptidase [Candidatus Babeliales bacterium]
MIEKLKLKNNCSSIWPLAIFVVAFYAVDALRLYIDISYLYVDRLVVWLLPTFLFIRFVLHQNPFEFLKLNTNVKRGILWGGIISGIHALLYVAFWYFWNSKVTVDYSVCFKALWDIVLTAGFIEEIVFRGFILGYLRNIYTFRIANITSSLLFMIAHIPYWIVFGQFSLPLYKILYDFLFVFTCGLLEGFFLKKTNSLWTCIIHHSTNNFLSFMVK